VEEIVLPADEFTQEEFAAVWERMLLQVESKSLSLVSGIRNEVPVVENNVIKFHVTNQTIKDRFLQMSDELLIKIRETLNNFELNFQIEIVESVEQKFYVSNEEKYNYLIQRNPKLAVFIQELNLKTR
jgi:DNA polymerase-3 subunit gamma/tau